MKLSPTGRNGQNEPNRQNIPIRTPEGAAIKAAFVNAQQGGSEMTVPWDRWTVFVCNTCGWASAGCYETKTGLATVPDTDCHECGSHDSVINIEHEVPAPRRLDLVHKRLKSEWVK